MSSLSKQIEEYIKALLAQETAGVVEIQRNFLSEYFNCVPSQINYVLSTRFTPVQGYMVETRRGGGGFVRIVSLQLDEDDDLQDALTDAIGSQLTQNDCEGLTAYLYHSIRQKHRPLQWIIAVFCCTGQICISFAGSAQKSSLFFRTKKDPTAVGSFDRRAYSAV